MNAARLCLAGKHVCVLAVATIALALVVVSRLRCYYCVGRCSAARLSFPSPLKTATPKGEMFWRVVLTKKKKIRMHDAKQEHG